MYFNYIVLNIVKYSHSLIVFINDVPMNRACTI